MKILLDQNISFRVAKKLNSLGILQYTHISTLNPRITSDIEIWQTAKHQGLCIMTFDSDFIDLSILRGSPPKVILLRIGNTSSTNLIQTLSELTPAIIGFLEDGNANFLEIKR